MKLNLLGITRRDNHQDEEATYTIGYDGHIPIALLLMIGSGYKNAIARYFNQITYTEEANVWQKAVLKKKIKLPENFAHQFEGINSVPFDGTMPPFDSLKPITQNLPFLDNFKPVSPDWMEKQMNPPADTTLPFYVYAAQFAKFVCMKTPGYESGGEGIVMTCPMSYINFWGRDQFKDTYTSIDVALEHILSEVVRVLKLREMPVDEINMTMPLEGYTCHRFKQYYGW